MQRRLHDASAALRGGDGVGGRDGFATERFDLTYDGFSRAGIEPIAIEARADIVDDDLGAFGRQQQGVFASQASTGARNECHSAVEPTL